MTPKSAQIILIFTIFWAAPSPAGDFTVADNGHQFTVADRGAPVLTFVYASPASDPGAPEQTAGAPAPTHYVHPLNGLQGEPVTADSPSIWSGVPGLHWGWSRVGVTGRLVNFDTSEGGHREFERWLEVDTESGYAAFGLQSAWLVEPERQAHAIETLSFVVHPVEGPQRYIDIGVLIRNVSGAAILLEGALPGTGLCFALNPDRADWTLEGSGGWMEPGGGPYLSPWAVCTYRDDRRSTRSGLAILQDSRNPAYATPNWFVEDGNRLSVGAPADFRAELDSGEFIEFRYRIILFRATGGGPDLTGEYARFMAGGTPPN